MKKSRLSNSALSISQSKTSIYLLAAAFFIYATGLLDVIIHSNGQKIYLDIARAAILLSFLLITIKTTPYNSKLIMLCLYSMLCVTVFHDMFILEITTGLLVALTINKKNTRNYLKISILATLFVVIPAMFLAKIGIINSVVFIAPSTADNTLTAASKDTFGFWHPNQITLLVAGSLLASFYIDSKKLLLVCLLTYAVLLGGTISRTFLPIPILIFLYTIFPSNSKLAHAFFRWTSLAIGVLATAISIITSLPIFLKSLLAPESYLLANKILSNRLQIIDNYMQNLNLFEIVTGWTSEKHELDSAYINMIFSQGYLVYLAVTLAFLYIQVIAFKNKMIKESLVVSLFMLIANFETPVGASSLIYITTLVATIRILDHKIKHKKKPPNPHENFNKNTLNTI